jgi:hypothetical protein
MNKKLLAMASLLALASATPASAALVVNSNGTVTGSGESGSTIINFNGIVGGSNMAGLTSALSLSFTQASLTSYVFNYTLNNNSTVNSRVTGFGFDTDPNATIRDQNASLNGTQALGVFSEVSTNQNVMGGMGFDVEQCLSTGNCQGGGNGGVLAGASGTGSFTLDFASAPVNGVFTLSDLFVRYQSVGPNQQQSGVGIVTSVPEPATWALMLMGFGAVGYSMRRRRVTARPMTQMA